MRIAIFGGTFDPIHAGHLMVAEQVRQAFGFEQVIFVPSAIPPHKPENGHASAWHRFMMAMAATLSNPGFKVSSIETDRPGTSYTVDTLRQMQALLGPEAELFFILGSDAFLELESWREAGQLFDLCRFVVICRPGAGREDVIKYLEREFFRRNPDLNPQIVKFPSCGEIDYDSRLFLVEAVSVNISSSVVRQLCRGGKSVRYLVPHAVEDYIRKYNLYST